MLCKYANVFKAGTVPVSWLFVRSSTRRYWKASKFSSPFSSSGNEPTRLRPGRRMLVIEPAAPHVTPYSEQ